MTKHGRPLLAARALLLWCVLPLLLLVASPRPAAAEGRLVVDAPQRPLELAKTPDGFVGRFVVRNVGDAPLDPRVTLLSSPADPRTPPGVTVRLDKGRLAPGQERRVEVRWPAGEGRAREAWGVLSIDAAGTRGDTLGLRARRDESVLGTLARLAVPSLPLWPLLGLLAIVLVSRFRPDDRLPRRIALAAATLDVVAASVIALRFDRALGRVDGNDGVQLVTRATLSSRLGVDLFLGVDGVSVATLLTVSVAALVAIALGERVALRTARVWGAALGLLAGALGILLVFDLALLVVAWGATFASAALLLMTTAPPGRTFAGRRLAAVGVWSTVLLAVVALFAASYAGRAFAVDGTRLAQGFGHPDLVRAFYGGVGRTLLGLPFVAGLTTLLLVALVPVLALFPLDGFVHDALEDGHTPAILVALLPALGLFVLVRWGLLPFPEGFGWASTTLAWLGAGTAFLGALSAWNERRLAALAATAVSVATGVGLVGIASQTPAGVLGALGTISSIPLTISLAGGACCLLAARAGTNDVARLRGLGGDARLLAGVLTVGAAGLVGLPGTLLGWGALLAFTGLFARLPLAAALAGLSLGVLALAVLSALATALGGTVSDELRESSVLEPFGGRLPDLSRRERAVLVPLALLVIVLGFSPRPLLGLGERAALDVAAFLDPPGPTQVAIRNVSPPLR